MAVAPARLTSFGFRESVRCWFLTKALTRSQSRHSNRQDSKRQVFASTCLSAFQFLFRNYRLKFFDRCGLDIFHVNPIGGIFAGVTSGAVSGRLALGARRLHTFERQIRERIGADELADLLDALIGGNKLPLGGRIHAVEAWRNSPRAGNAHVNFECAGVAYHANDFTAGRGAEDEI